jgi:AmmeMemoRadiSam system protein A
MELSAEQGELLVQVARCALMKRLGLKPSAYLLDRLNAARSDPALLDPCGSFVTLKLKGDLRGCIGNLSACEPLVESVDRNAVNAGFQDPRFGPLTAAELEQVEVEVSVLTPACRLDYAGAEDLLRRLRPGVDGVIIRRGYASATFLPQVWEQLPKPADFLGHLCLKAGLGRDAWKKSKLEVSTYQVQYFEEADREP